jgi:hypothetical protein
MAASHFSSARVGRTVASSLLAGLRPRRKNTAASGRKRPRLTLETLEERRVLDSTVVFNEVMYHPQDNDESLEWIELHNQQAVDMDLSNWRITGGVNYTFPAGTRLGGGDYLVIAASPDDLEVAQGVTDALGPYTGTLANSGELIRLVSVGGRTMDEFEYGDDGDWSPAADGGGVTLAKREPNLGTADFANWTISRQIGGTPGARNFVPQTPQVVETLAVPFSASWQYCEAGDQGTAWRGTSFNANAPESCGENSWSAGNGVFFGNTAQTFPEPKGTQLTLGEMTYYFRTAFIVDEAASGASLKIRPIIDDGAVYYLNGKEIFRQNLPAAPAAISHTTPAFPAVTVATYSGPFSVSASDLVDGENVLAVEVHQNNIGSNDVTFAAEFTIVEPLVETGADLPNLALNEVAGSTNPGFSVELYNRGDTTLDLTGIVVTRDGAFAEDYILPATSLAAGGYLSLTQAQLGFAPDDGEKIFVYSPNKAALLDAIVVKTAARGRSPSGAGDWHYVDALTPGAANVVTLYDQIVINEIMYHHRPIQPQPAEFDETPIFSLDATWNYEDSGTDRGTAWRSPTYDDSAWANGAGLFHSEAGTLPGPKNTQLAADRDTYYFRKSFNFVGDPTNVKLSLSPVVDDGAVYYLNGVEIYRQNMPLGEIGYSTSAQTIVQDAGQAGPIIVDAEGLIDGTNVLAVEVHQASAPTGGGPQVSMEPGYQIAWDGSDGDFSTPANPAPVPANDALLTGITAFGSGQYGAGIHLIANVRDGLYGNSNSWIANPGDANPYIGLNLNGARNISSIAWGRDNGNTVTDACGGTCADRSAGTYTIQVTTVASPGTGTVETQNAATGWQTVGTVTIGPAGPGFTPHLRHRYTLSQNGSPIEATGLRIKTSNNGLGIDEIEINAAAGSQDTDAAFGLALSTVVETSPATDYAEVPEEWIELYNRGSTTVDLTGWRIDEGIDYDFAPGTTIAPGGYLVVANNKAALAAIYPTIDIVGNFSNALANSGDRFVLKDAQNNVADEVRYYDGGRWPGFADGRGSTLELADPDADNSRAESWRASDESSKSQWQAFSYRGVAMTEFTPARWNEFVVGLFGDGEVLLDDISVIESPGTTAAQKIVNGTFQSDTIGQLPASWRINGNHQRSFVVADPTNPTNKVLKLVSSGQTQDRSNHAETTFIGNAPAVNGREYEISFRAKWLAGTDQFNTRLYFNRLAKRTTLDSPDHGGTPGSVNSIAVVNAGPTYNGFSHTPVVPALAEPVTVSVTAADPDNVVSMTLRYSVGGGAFASVAMTPAGSGRYTGVIPGQGTAGAVVQFYVEGTDGQGATSTYPAAGAASRALYKVQDNQAQGAGKHTIRMIMTPADAAWLHDITNVMSSEEMRATVIYDESEVYYNVGVSLKGSMAARPNSQFTSFRIKFNADQKFRGVHEDIALDRSGRGAIVPSGQDEFIAKHMMAVAGGGLPSQYDDLVYIVSPLGNVNGSAILMLGEYSEVFLDEQYENGGDGPSFNFDLIYYQTATSGDPVTGPKIPVGYAHPGYNVDLEYLGTDEETYRWNFRAQNNRQESDYADLIEFLEAMSLTGSTTGGALDVATQATMDVDQWMRVFAAQSLAGAGPDLYGRGLPHNLRLYVRPEDGKVLALPWDWDLSAFGLSTTADLFPGGNIRKVVDIPANKRLFYGHLNDLMNTTFNSAYMTYWTTHFSSLLPGQNFAPALTYLNNRGAHVASQLPPSVPFTASTGDVANSTTLIGEIADAVAFVPTELDGSNTEWTENGYAPAGWLTGTTGVGYERVSGYENLIGLDVEAAIDADNNNQNDTNSVYVRVPFNVADVASIDRLKLLMRYDDGFVAYINGVRVAAGNAPPTLAWNSEASANRDDGAAVQYQEFDISQFRSALVLGENVLAIHGLNQGSGSGDMLISPMLIAEETSQGNNEITVDGPTVTLGGSAWINVREIRVSGYPDPIPLTFPTVSTWQATIPVSFGTHELEFTAYDFQGNAIGTDSMTVTSTHSDRPIEDFLRVSEMMYHPADPSPAEIAAGFVDSEEFEFIELVNVSTTRTLDLADVEFANGISFNFTDSAITSLAPGEYVLVVGNLEAFTLRYGDGMPVAGVFGGNLNNNGERILLTHTGGTILHDFTYDDAWYPETDGVGPSMVVANLIATKSLLNSAEGWRLGSNNGSPGGPDSPVGVLGDLNGDQKVGLADLAILQRHFGIASGALASQGDLNNDGAIDRKDVAILAKQFGTGSGAGSPAAAAVVTRATPEIAGNAASTESPTRATRRPRPSTVIASAVDAVLGESSLRVSRTTSNADAASARVSRSLRRS